MSKKLYFILLIAAACLTCPGGLSAHNLAAPADVKNMHILYVSHLFMPLESVSPLPRGSKSFSAAFINSNTNYMFLKDGLPGNFDVETASLITGCSYALTDSIELRAMLPYYYNSGGFMDGIIEGFHKALPFSVRNGGREYVDDDEIHIWYRREQGGPDINSSFYGFGDPSFFVKKSTRGNGYGFAGSLGIKPRVGTVSFINSGTTDLGLSVTAFYKAWIFDLYAMTGFTYFDRSGFYAKELEQQRDWMVLFAPGAGLRLSDSLYAVVQFYCISSPYNTGVKRIDTFTVINTFALRWRAMEGMVMQFSFDEDSFTYASADITLSIRCSYLF